MIEASLSLDKRQTGAVAYANQLQVQRAVRLFDVMPGNLSQPARSCEYVIVLIILAGAYVYMSIYLVLTTNEMTMGISKSVSISNAIRNERV